MAHSKYAVTAATGRLADVSATSEMLISQPGQSALIFLDLSTNISKHPSTDV